MSNTRTIRPLSFSSTDNHQKLGFYWDLTKENADLTGDVPTKIGI
jgi:hypothetical protein